MRSLRAETSIIVDKIVAFLFYVLIIGMRAAPCLRRMPSGKSPCFPAGIPRWLHTAARTSRERLKEEGYTRK